MRGFHGFQPAAQRGKAQPFASGGAVRGFKGGGPVRGPGTGTSDDVADQVPSGTYIMPADSTQAVGEQQLAAMGGGPRGFAPAKKAAQVPVNLSNGEFKLPPEQVHAIGVQALDQARDATHVPVAARGFAPGVRQAATQDRQSKPAPTRGVPRAFEGEPPLFFANGGVVRGLSSRRGFVDGGVADDEPKRPNSFGDAAAAAADPGVTQIAAPASSPANTSFAGAEPSSAGTGRGFISPSKASSAAPALSASAPTSSATEIAPGVFRSGNSYSDSAAGTFGGLQPRGFSTSAQRSPVGMPVEQAQREGLIGQRIGYAPAFDQRLNGGASGASLQNVATANTLAAGDSQQSMARGFQPAQAAPSVEALTVRHSGNDWAARNELRNAQVAASSITQSDKWGKGGDRAATANYAALLAADNAARGAQPDMNQTTMRENAALTREGMQQTGANQRAAMTQAAETQRTTLQQALIDARERRTAQHQNNQDDIARQRLALDTQRAGQDRIPAGYRRSADGSGLEFIPGGPADPAAAKSKTLNEGQSKALTFGSRMQESGRTLDELAAAGVNQPGLVKRAADVVGLGALVNGTQSPQQQQVEQAQRDFVNATLRKESGAAISNSEFESARQQYFPQPGDSPAVIEQKRKNRELSTRGMLAEVPDSQNRVNQVLGATSQQPSQPQQRAVVRTGTHNGRKVVQYADGSINYED